MVIKALLQAVAILLMTAVLQAQSETDAFAVKTENSAGIQTLRFSVTGGIDLTQVKILNSRLTLTPTESATAAAPGKPSHSLVISGSAFSTTTGNPVDVSFFVRTAVTDAGQQRLEIVNNAGSPVASFHSSGALLFGNGAATGNKTLFADTGASTLPFIRFNPASGKWEMSSNGMTISPIADTGSIGPAVSSINGLSGALSLVAETPALVSSSGSAITIKDSLLLHAGGNESITGTKTFSTFPSFTDVIPFAVASATKVSNLNADLVDGKDSSGFVQSITGGTGIVVGGTMPSLTIALDPTFGDTFVKNQTASVQSAGFNISGDALIGGAARVTGKMGIGTAVPTDKQLVVEGDMVRIEVQ